MAPKNDSPRGEPNVAALLTWFVPGAGHVYVGRPIFGLVAFLVIMGLFVAGLRLSDGMTFQYLQEELRTRLAPALTPEVGNLGAMLWQAKRDGGLYGGGLVEPWPPHMALGTMLTALAGILNVMLMTRAYLDAKLGKRSWRSCPAVQCLVGWAVPGLGHLMQGRKKRGMLVFLLLVGLFVLATCLADGSNLDRERHFYYWAGQFLVGLPAIVAEWVHGHARLTGYVRYADAGIVLGCLAGMLNVLALLDVFSFGEQRLAEEAPKKEESSVLSRLQSEA